MDYKENDWVFGGGTLSYWQYRPFSMSENPLWYSNILYILSLDGSQINMFKNEKLKRIVQLKISGTKVTQRERDKFLSNFDSRDKVVIQKAGFPSTKPVVSDIVVDEKEYLWLYKGDNYRSFGNMNT